MRHDHEALRHGHADEIEVRDRFAGRECGIAVGVKFEVIGVMTGCGVEGMLGARKPAQVPLRDGNVIIRHSAGGFHQRRHRRVVERAQRDRGAVTKHKYQRDDSKARRAHCAGLARELQRHDDDDRHCRAQSKEQRPARSADQLGVMKPVLLHTEIVTPVRVGLLLIIRERNAGFLVAPPALRSVGHLGMTIVKKDVLQYGESVPSYTTFEFPDWDLSTFRRDVVHCRKVGRGTE